MTDVFTGAVLLFCRSPGCAGVFAATTRVRFALHRPGNCLCPAVTESAWPQAGSLACLPKTAVRRSSGTSTSPKRMRSPIHSVTFLARTQLSFRLTKVPLLEPASCIETRPSSASSIRACTRDKSRSQGQGHRSGSRPHGLGFFIAHGAAHSANSSSSLFGSAV